MMYAAASGDVCVSADHDSPEKPSYPAGTIGLEPGPSRWSGHRAAIAPQAAHAISTIRMRIQATRRRRSIADDEGRDSWRTLISTAIASLPAPERHRTAFAGAVHPCAQGFRSRG